MDWIVEIKYKVAQKPWPLLADDLPHLETLKAALEEIVQAASEGLLNFVDFLHSRLHVSLAGTLATRSLDAGLPRTLDVGVMD